MKTAEYLIIQSSSIVPLGEAVNEKISEGWKPLGGVAIAHDRFQGMVFAQAMVKDAAPYA